MRVIFMLRDEGKLQQWSGAERQWTGAERQYEKLEQNELTAVRRQR